MPADKFSHNEFLAWVEIDGLPTNLYEVANETEFTKDKVPFQVVRCWIASEEGKVSHSIVSMRFYWTD